PLHQLSSQLHLARPKEITGVTEGIRTQSEHRPPHYEIIRRMLSWTLSACCRTAASASLSCNARSSVVSARLSEFGWLSVATCALFGDSRISVLIVFTSRRSSAFVVHGEMGARPQR